MFKIIGADGNEYGPVSVDQLKQWIAEGRVNAQTKVLTDGATEWKPLAEVPDLAALLPITPPPLASGVPPIPGASQLPNDVRERDYELDIGDCISRAWQLLTGPKVGLVIGGVAIWLGIQVVISLFAQIPLIGLLFSLANLVIGGPLLGGVYFFLLRAIRGGAADVGDVFAGFKYRFVQLFLGYLVMSLCIIAALLPGVVLFIAGAIPLAHHHEFALVGIALVLAGVIVMFVPVIYISISWWFALPLIMDKQLDFWPAMQLSRQVVGKHWWTMFGFAIIVGLISLVGLLFCCVGALFTMPLAFAATMYAYETMFSLNPGDAATATTPGTTQTHI